ncbi:hypothetical protein VNO77_27364 [Canavalia gladiata]|uniref:Peptidase C14 caspase domain-containing protein n=1 Tax=Canavalia gladiata TaxID=3824 RepID=A0AAN9Q6E2_CANGL
MGLSVSKKNVVTTEEGSKKALLIGVNYRTGTLRELWGCHNDVKITKQYLMKHFQFQEENIIEIVDSETCQTQPTGENIRLALRKLVQSAKPGDILFFHFSGHGKRELSKAMDDDTGYDEFIIAADGDRITDCCHSGGMIEAAKEQIGDSTKERRRHSRCSGFKTDNTPHAEYNGYVGYRSLPPSAGLSSIPIFNFWRSPKPYINHKCSHISFDYQQFPVSRIWRALQSTFKILPWSSIKIMENFKPSVTNPPDDDAILLSGCQSYEKAQEREFSGVEHGVFTKAIETVINKTGGVVTHRDLVLQVREILDRQGIPQKPGLYCSDLHANAFFLR